jgi:hypothetical protein
MSDMGEGTGDRESERVGGERQGIPSVREIQG